MLSAQQLSIDILSNKGKGSSSIHPHHKTEIVSRYVTPSLPNPPHEQQETSRRKSKKVGSVLQSRSFGLEIKPEQVIWKGWKPGEEYTRNVTLKNICNRTQRIRFKVPSSKFFTTLFPQVIVLSAGTSFTLPVTFKPLEKEKYEDEIEFSTKKGSFSLVLQALLPQTKLLLPDSIQFGLTAAHDMVELTFEIRNMSELTTPYMWKVPQPFAIIPLSGILQPRASCFLKVTFHPQSANVFEAVAVCSYGENCYKTVKLEGIGKYPHLIVKTALNTLSDATESIPCLMFGNINVHKSVEKTVLLQNLSNVKAPFKINRICQSLWMDQAFHSLVESGVVSPMSSMKLPIRFIPHATGATSIEHFEIIGMENTSKSSFKCTGTCIGPDVNLNESVVSFGLISPEKQSSRTFHICNDSDCEAVYQILLSEHEGVFRVDCKCGIISAHTTVTICATFNPTHAINYHRQAVVLVHDQGPLFIDLIGTCHTEEMKPPLLQADHVRHYAAHAARSLTRCSPDILQSQLRLGRLTKDNKGCLALNTEKGDVTDLSEQSDLDRYFDDGHYTEVTHDPPHVSLDQFSILMGQVQCQSIYHATVQLTNHTKGKVTAMWINDPSSAFQVHPVSCEIPPLKSTDFRIIFKPDVPNQFFGKELECYAFYTCSKDYRKVEDIAVFPSWLVTVDVSGHTFDDVSETFLPDVTLSSRRLTFPPVTKTSPSYRTILIENKGTTPLLYQFVKPSGDGFSVKQQQGLITTKYHISLVRLSPTRVATYQSSMLLRLNDDTKNDVNVRLVGSSEQPELLLSNGGEMFFRPTCISTSTKRNYEIHNIGRIPVRFRWHLNHTDAPCLMVEPREGVVQPNEVQNHTWTFSPREEKKYVFKPVCLTWPHDDEKVKDEYRSDEARRFPLRVVADGTEGDIKVEKGSVDFGCVICGSASSQSIVLFNNSHCDIHFRLSMAQFINSDYGENPDVNEPFALELSMTKGVLSARTKVTVTATARPIRRVLYTWALYYELLNSAGECINPNCRILLCDLSADGVYPTLTVTDARPSGSGINISKTQLWRWFSFDHLNNCLDLDPHQSERIYSIHSRHSATRRPSVYTKSIIDFNFGAASIDSEPCYVSAMVKNTGLVDTEWAFRFPKDLRLEVDYWAENGAFEPDVLHELHIQDNKLFTVQPRSGTLKPGESQTVLLTYKHDVAGTHRLPVLFKIEHGKEVLVNFIGVTVEPNRRYLHFPGTNHTFTPVAIGGSNPPKQLYEMYNGGNMAVVYEVDTEPLRELQSSNYDHPILTCLNPKGEISPGTSANLEWIFSPLESKTYTVDLPIHMIGGESALITFQGIGYDSRAMGATMPMLDQPAEFTGVPSLQKVPVPDQVIFLSEERISYGNMPRFGKSRHVTFLCNKSPNRTFSYTWHAASDDVNEVLRVEPIAGQLGPGDRIMTRITFCAPGPPSFYDLDLVCEVKDDIKIAEYKVELAAWEKECERQAAEFVILGTDVDDDVTELRTEFHAGPSRFETKSPRRNLENLLNKQPTPLHLTESVASKYTAKSERHSFQTLPPIRYEDPVKLPSNRSRLVRQEERTGADEWVQPQPPRPFICHLGVTARTHDVTEFRTNFPADAKKYFVDRNQQVDRPTPAVKPPAEQYTLTTCDQEEKNLVISVMSTVIRGLLDDPTFREEIREITNEPTPYFGQLAKEEVQEAVETKPAQEETVKKEEEHREEVAQPPTETLASTLMSEILQQGGSVTTSFTSANSPRDSEPGSVIPTCHSKSALNYEIKKNPEFGNLLEDALASTIGNILEEAIRGDVILTARPRVVALPPSREKSGSRRAPSNTSASSRAESAGSQRRKTKTPS